MFALSCKPELAGRPSAIEQDVVLAIQSSPAEVNPRLDPPLVVGYEALYVGPRGSPDPSGIDWAFCDQPKPLALTGPISPACLVKRARPITTVVPGAEAGTTETRAEPVLTPFGNGLTAQAAVPADACRVFGPIPGESAARPADPDITGGYYQPVRVLVPTAGEPQYSVGVTRLDCGLAGATQEQSLDYTKRYRPNENPALEAVVLRHANGREENLVAASSARRAGQDTGSPADAGPPAAADAGDAGDAGRPSGSIDAGLPNDAGAPIPSVKVSPGERVTLTASWAACPTRSACGDGICGPGEDNKSCKADCEVPAGCRGSTCRPSGCTGSEPYVKLDLTLKSIVDHRESIRVSWFAAQGSFDHDRTGRAEAEAAVSKTDNGWTAPASPGEVHLYVVIRDDRGGVGWSTYVVDVGG